MEKHSLLLIPCLKIPRDKIERSTLTGENRQVILHGVQFPYGLTVYQQDIFWTDWAERSVFRAQKDDGSGFTVLAKDLLHQPNDIRVYSPSKQETCSSFCQQFNGGCSHTCVSGKSNTTVHKFILTGTKTRKLNCLINIAPGPSGPECQCPHDGKWYLANNGKDCIQDTGKRCEPGQFTCLDGNCIHMQWACDGYMNCADNSDELERVCGET